MGYHTGVQRILKLASFPTSICIKNRKSEIPMKFCIKKSTNMTGSKDFKIGDFLMFPSIKCSSDLRPCPNKYHTNQRFRPPAACPSLNYTHYQGILPGLEVEKSPFWTYFDV